MNFYKNELSDVRGKVYQDDSLRSYSQSANVTLIAFIFSLHYEAVICFRNPARWFIGSAAAASFLMAQSNRPRKGRRHARGARQAGGGQSCPCENLSVVDVS